MLFTIPELARAVGKSDNYVRQHIFRRAPDLIGPLNGQPLQKIGINPVLGMPGGGRRRW